MIAIVSSTIAPSKTPGHDGLRSSIDPSLRLQQTIGSVLSLQSVGFSEIIVADNSATPPTEEQRRLLLPARLIHFGHFPHRNKGLGEIYLLLAALDEIPGNRPIMKLSGRYAASINLCHELGQNDFAGLFRTGENGVRNVSTRAYAVRNQAFYRRFLESVLNGMYSQPWKLCGPRSAWSLFRRLVLGIDDGYPYADPTSGIEIVAAEWLGKSKSSVLHLNQLGVTGILGGHQNPTINE